MTTQSKPHKLGLVLSGGGVRGLSHVGTVKALMETGANFDIIAGTSIGAIVGVLLADGYHPDEIAELVKQAKRKDFVKTSIGKDHLLSFDTLKHFLKKHLHTNTFEGLKIPLIVTATDLIKGQIQHFKEGDLIEKIIASASIPVIFPPVNIQGNLYVDGGLLSNLPAHTIREDCEKIIGVSVNPESLGLEDGKRMNNIIQIAERSFYVVMYGNVIQEKDLCDLFIEPYLLNDYGLFSFDKMKEIKDLGYNFTKKLLEKNVFEYPN